MMILTCDFRSICGVRAVSKGSARIMGSGGVIRAAAAQVEGDDDDDDDNDDFSRVQPRTNDNDNR